MTATSNQQQYFSSYQQQPQVAAMSAGVTGYQQQPAHHHQIYHPAGQQQVQHTAAAAYHHHNQHQASQATMLHHPQAYQQQQHQQQHQNHQVQHHHHLQASSLDQQQQQQQHQQLHPLAGHQVSSAELAHLGPSVAGALRQSVPGSTGSPAPLFGAIEATKSTKGASKLRRDLINVEIAHLRQLLPLDDTTKNRLSHLQLMALVLVYVRKSIYFEKSVSPNYEIIPKHISDLLTPSGFSKSLNGFLMMVTQKGKLLYISNNASEYLGHSMEDLLSRGDEVYDIIEDQDKKCIRNELLSNEDDNHANSASSKSLQQTANYPSTETRIALCRMNVSISARRQMRFGDQKVVLIEGHYSGYLPLSTRHEPVFLATCTPVVMPETRESVHQGSTNIFTSIHSIDMKFLYIDNIGEHHLGLTKQQIHGKSWYDLVQTEYLHEAAARHKRISTGDQERSTILLLKLTNSDQSKSIWVHTVMQVKEATDSANQPVIVCTNQVLTDREAEVMQNNPWLYQFYSPHTKMNRNFSVGSPLGANEIGSPSSVCSDSEIGNDLKQATPVSLASINTSTHPNELSEKSPANLIGGQLLGKTDKSPASCENAYPTKDNYPPTVRLGYNRSLANSESTGAHLVKSYPPTNLKQSSKLSPILHSPSASSTMSSSSPGSSGSHVQQNNPRYHQLTGPSQLKGASLDQFNLISSHRHNPGSTGSSSVSSTSSTSSHNESSASPSDLAISTAGAANSVCQSSVGVSPTAASLYAGIDTAAAVVAAAAIDPLQQLHNHSRHQSMYSDQHRTAAVNYANQVMAVQRHHQHSYHPYQHPQHNPAAHHNQHHHNQQQLHHHTQHSQHQQQHQQHHNHHQQQHHHHTAHLAPNHHNHHTAPHAALYGPPSHHHVHAHAHQHQIAVASSAAVLNNALNHHHHHHQAAAVAYHSAAAAAAAGGVAHPALHHNSHNHHQTSNSIQSPYHHSASASAATSSAHQGVSFHYNKIAAAVNASA